MRYRGRVDQNQKRIATALRVAGATVEFLSSVGSGCPDLLVGFRGANLLLEVKNPEKPKADRQLTEAQATWHSKWAGQCAVVSDVSEAITLLNSCHPFRSVAGAGLEAKKKLVNLNLADELDKAGLP